MRKRYNHAVFVTFEGPEGAGKSTAIAGVADRLRALGANVTVTREPGSGPIGSRIRALLLEPTELPMPARCELFLFLADRSQHVATLIRPALDRGDVVLCDRFGDSTVVYQGHARGLSIEKLKELNAFATDCLSPNLTFLLDLEPEIGLARISHKDRLDSESNEFHRAVREGFLKEASADPGRWFVVDATRDPQSIIEACTAEILRRLRT